MEKPARELSYPWYESVRMSQIDEVAFIPFEMPSRTIEQKGVISPGTTTVQFEAEATCNSTEELWFPPAHERYTLAERKLDEQKEARTSFQMYGDMCLDDEELLRADFLSLEYDYLEAFCQGDYRLDWDHDEAIAMLLMLVDHENSIENVISSSSLHPKMILELECFVKTIWERRQMQRERVRIRKEKANGVDYYYQKLQYDRDNSQLELGIARARADTHSHVTLPPVTRRKVFIFPYFSKRLWEGVLPNPNAKAEPTACSLIQVSPAQRMEQNIDGKKEKLVRNGSRPALPLYPLAKKTMYLANTDLQNPDDICESDYIYALPSIDLILKHPQFDAFRLGIHNIHYSRITDAVRKNVTSLPSVIFKILDGDMEDEQMLDFWEAEENQRAALMAKLESQQQPKLDTKGSKPINGKPVIPMPALPEE